MKTRIIIALSILCINFPDGISQGFGKKSGNANVYYFNNSQTEANRIPGIRFNGIFNSVYYPGTGAGSPVTKSQSCTGNITGIYESADDQTNVISERTEIFIDSTQASINRRQDETLRNKVMKRKDMVNGEKVNNRK